MSITDGTFICELCGEWSTGCSLCGYTAPLLDMRESIRKEDIRNRAAEIELQQQERAIRYAADKRAGWF